MEGRRLPDLKRVRRIDTGLTHQEKYAKLKLFE
jgi:hypothetical protein